MDLGYTSELFSVFMMIFSLLDIARWTRTFLVENLWALLGSGEGREGQDSKTSARLGHLC